MKIRGGWMLNYTSRVIVQYLKKYEMFLDSLKIITDTEEQNKIIDELDKLEEQILLETNREYEEAYALLNKSQVFSLEEEKKRLEKIIMLIEERSDYLENRKLKHQELTGSLVELTTFLGNDKLEEYKRNLDIIEKYKINKVDEERLTFEIRQLDSKINEANKKIKANNILNISLEKKLVNLIHKSLTKLDLFTLATARDEIESEYDKLAYATKMAKENLKNAKDSENDELIIECDDMLSEITLDFEKVKTKKCILELIDIYDHSASGYEKLLEKREDINNILKEIPQSELYGLIGEEVEKQYTTIKIEGQDLATYQSLSE